MRSIRMNLQFSLDSSDSGPNHRLNKSVAASAALTLANAIMMAGTLHAQATPAGSVAPASTADNPLKLEPVEVRDDHEQVGSLKFTEPVLDTPQTIDVIPPEVYSAQGATTLSDVLRNTPGITFFAGE